MNKLKQCIFTVILLLTCFVASPLIYKKIWETSVAKQPAQAVKDPDITAPTGEGDVQQPTAEPTEPVTDENGETIPAPSDNGEGAPAEPATEDNNTTIYNFTQSGIEYFSDALFIGDSRTVGLSEYGTLRNADYFCSIGLAAYRIDEEYVNGYTLRDKLSSKQYGKVYLMLGINEVGNDPEYTAAAYRRTVDTIKELQPNAIIYLEANLHVAQWAQTESITNAAIDRLNSRIREMADGSRTFYLDVNGVFDDSAGALTSDYTSDGVHVLAKHYQTWCDWLCMNTVGGSGSVPIAADAPASTNTIQTEAATVSTELPQNDVFSNE